MLLQVELGDVEPELVYVGELGLNEFLVDVGSECFLEELAVFGHLDRFVEIVRHRRDVQLFTLDRRELIEIERIPGLIRDIIESRENTRFERCLFMVFGDSALNFETVYHMLVPDFKTYGETHHAINLEIFRRFGEEGIEFAYPTQKVYFEGVNLGAQGGS